MSYDSVRYSKLLVLPLNYTKQDTMKYLLIAIQKEFNIKTPSTTFLEINAEIVFIQDTYIEEVNDLKTCLAFQN